MSTGQMSKSSREIADRKVRSGGRYLCACGEDVMIGRCWPPASRGAAADEGGPRDPRDLALSAQTVVELFVFRFELEPRGLGLELQQRAEIDMLVTVADHALNDLASE